VILEATGLSIGYPGHAVGTDITLAVAEGEVVALLGPNGGGKTTLLKTLIGLIPPRAGAVRLGGRDLGALSPAERARLAAYVPQSSGSAFAFTVEEIVLMGRTAHLGVLARPGRRDRAIAAAQLERLGIDHLADRPITMISGGERQLAYVARALAQEPRLVVLDEPTASLDLSNQGKILQEMRRLAESGLAVLFTTHDPNHALAVADRACLLRDGSVLALGAAEATIDRERLEALYRTPVDVLREGDRRAFLPNVAR
jgi:iron complex transport system ATP-binding protein